MKTFDQGSCFDIGLGIESLLRLAIAPQKAAQSQHVAVVGRADNDRACAGLD